MSTRKILESNVVATTLLFVLWLSPASVWAQESVAHEANLWTRDELTGDWGGTRSQWKENGVDLDFKLTQFYQGVTSGGIRHDDEYNGVFMSQAKFDLGKLVGWQFWSADLQAQSRFGGPLLGGTGTINPANTAAIIPGADDTVTALTALNFTRLIPIDLKAGELFAVAFGRFNLVDLLEEEFFAGGGTERFMNMAQIGPLTVLRQVPLITNAVSFAYVRGGEPFITFSLLDPNDHSTTAGLSDLFEDGVTFSPGINFATKYFGMSGKHTVGGAITTKKYTPFDAIRQVIIPEPASDPIEPKRGSWSVNYTFRQYLVERGKNDGWGFFMQVSFADKDTSPITKFLDVGLGGNGLFPGRPDDEFGLAYAYTDLSEELKDDIDLLAIGDVRVEHQVELFYNLHITPWFRLTGDLQVVRPTRQAADTAVIPAVRVKLLF
ncbi:MAG TPA: carbohydrate porin [Steroidobacteraceae bacterium]|nr:carbohydrate porin [Steroidobacteraceae bacterium]